MGSSGESDGLVGSAGGGVYLPESDLRRDQYLIESCLREQFSTVETQAKHLELEMAEATCCSRSLRSG